MDFPSCGQANEDAKESWAKSQSYNLYRKINSIYLVVKNLQSVPPAVAGGSNHRTATVVVGRVNPPATAGGTDCLLPGRNLRDKSSIFLKPAGVVEPDQVFFEDLELLLTDAGADLAEDLFL
jgi:hypothetical protein